MPRVPTTGATAARHGVIGPLGANRCRRRHRRRIFKQQRIRPSLQTTVRRITFYFSPPHGSPGVTRMSAALSRLSTKEQEAVTAAVPTLSCKKILTAPTQLDVT